MHDNDPFLRWFVSWKQARHDDSPIGWYTLDDLEAAFAAGALTAREYVDDLAGKMREDIIAAVLAKMAAADGQGAGTWTPIKD